MSHRTLQSVQERYPWIMAPLAWMDALFTPRRWTMALDRGTARLSRGLAVDTARLARLIRRLSHPLAALRARLLEGRPRLMRLAWAIRKSFWAAVWASAVLLRLWPRRVPVPDDPTPIRLIPAPESYPDFQSPALVVPSDVPRAEMSLPSAMTVQVLHLLQDVYPIIASHQPLASDDPVQRLDEAYSWMYRVVRRPPAWHADLQEARRRGRLLEALAVGGPFAKLLERTTGGRCDYLIDLDYLRAYPARPGLAGLGCRIFYAERDGELTATGIEYGGRIAEPGDTRWPYLQRLALCSLLTHTTVWRHGMQYHVGGVAPFAVMTHQLPPGHPLRRLLAPHIADTMSTNYHTHLTLRRSGFDVTGFSFSYDTILRYYDDGARYFDIARLDPHADAERRGIRESLEYPHLRQASRYVALIGRYVTAYIDRYYPDEGALARDAAAHVWFDSLNRYVVRGITGYAPHLTKASLVRLCTLFIYSVSVEHEDNTMWNYAPFLPAIVREDGTGETVGEVQSVVNFQLVIASATNRLMRDTSHVALDAEAGAIMRRFRESLVGLQIEMDREPHRYWTIYPAELEASVSA